MTELEISVAHSADYGEIAVADFAICRVGGVSSASLNDLALRETAAYLDIVYKAEENLRTLTPDLDSLLFSLVPKLDDDRELRRKVLAVKRNIHNGRFTENTLAEALKLRAMLPDSPERSLLSNWCELATEHNAALAMAERQYAVELSRASGHLYSQLKSHRLRQGIAIASSDLLAELYRADLHNDLNSWAPETKLSRSCLSYLTRAAMKTSPLSTFTRIDFATIGQTSKIQQERQPTDVYRCIVTIAKGLPHLFLTRLAQIEEFAAAFTWEVNSGLSKSMPDGKSVRVLKAQNHRNGSFSWRHESVQEQIIPAVLNEVLRPGQKFSYSEIIQAINNYQDVNSGVTFASLCNQGLLRPVAPYSQRESKTLSVLAETIAALDTPKALAIAVAMQSMQKLIDQTGAADGAARLKILEEIRRQAMAICDRAEIPVPEWLTTAKLLFEDVAYTGEPVELPSSVAQDLATAAALYRPGTIRSKLYDYLYAAFVQKFGPDGETSDILGFLFDFIGRADFPEILARSIADDKFALTTPGGHRRSHLTGGDSAVPPSLTMFYQIAAESQDDLQRGNYLLVVNQVNSGEGGLLARFTDVLGPKGENLRSGLRDWLQELYGQLPLELPVCGESHSLQGSQGICERTLQWPGELSTTERDSGKTVRLDQIRLCAKPDGTLQFTDEHRRSVSITYQGIVPSYFAPQALRLLMLIVDPWIRNYSPNNNDIFAEQKLPNAVSGIQYFPREQKGRIVLSRTRWEIPAEQLPVRNKAESSFNFFVRIQNWRQANGLPEEVFVAASENRLSLQAKERKPVWVDLTCAHSLELLSQMAAAGSPLTLTEVLPSRKQHWLTSGGSSQKNFTEDIFASEFMSLVRWPMPCHQPPARIPCENPPIPATHAKERWLFWKIYPSSFEQLDDVLRHIVAPFIADVRETSPLERWFFVRYMDERGWHIRLRLCGPLAEHERWSQKLKALITDRLFNLPVANSPQKRLIPVASFKQQTIDPGYISAPYEPEYEKYGGLHGMVVAEELFQATSDLALNILNDVSDELDRSRTALALMRLHADRFYQSAEDRARFILYYFWYWSGQDRPGAADVRARLMNSASKRKAYVSGQLATLPAHKTWGRILRTYDTLMECTIAKLELAANHVAADIDSLSFDYLHMLNNRIGILPPEEAYLAALLI